MLFNGIIGEIEDLTVSKYFTCYKTCRVAKQPLVATATVIVNKNNSIKGIEILQIPHVYTFT